jgi:cytoskeletal protein CcmA (bactofilin family)
MNHFDEMTCMLYLDGQLEAEHARELAVHAGACATCRELLKALEGEGVWLRESLLEEDGAVPARLMEPPARARAPWGWIAAFGFGVAGAYTLWSGFVEPWRQQLSQAGFGEGNLLTMLVFHGSFWKGWESMTSLMEFLGMMTLGIIVVALLRRHWRRWATVAVVMGMLAGALALPQPVAAAGETHKGNPDYTLAVGETVKGDLIIYEANLVNIDGNVEGDVITCAHKVTVRGHVNGDVIGWQQELRVMGQVDGNIRAGAESIFIGGAVARNATLFASDVEMDPKSRIGGGATVWAANANLNGRIERDVLAGMGEATLRGFIGGNVKAMGDRMTIDSGAEIAGHTLFRGNRAPDVATGAKLGSPVEFELEKRRPDYESPHFYWWQAIWLGGTFLYGLVLALVMPVFFADVVRAGRGAAFGIGLLVFPAVPILAIIACVTVVGLAIGITGLLLWLLAMYTAQIFVGTLLGEFILGKVDGFGPTLARLALGLVLLRIVRNVPYAGHWITFAVIVWGMGAMAVALYRHVKRQPVLA